MAILKSGNDEYEVRIKRYPEKTYFDEYVKTGDREKSSATSCNRYIVGENGVRYTIEVTLKKGFSFGDFEFVRAKLYIPGEEDPISQEYVCRPEDYEDGIKSDITTELQYADVTVEGSRMLDARFSFRNLLLGTFRSLLVLCILISFSDEKLVNETEIMGISPQSLGHFVIKVYKFRWETRQLTDKEYRREVKEYRREVKEYIREVAAAKNVSKLAPQLKPSSMGADRREQFLWDAQKVDEDSFKKDGIAYAIG